MSAERRCSESHQRRPVGSRADGSGLTMDILMEENRLTDEQLDQPIPRYQLFDIARLIPNWYDYAGKSSPELD